MTGQMRKYERGSVLLWGIVILLTLTIIGIAASRMATVDSRIAGNEMVKMFSCDGCESILEEVNKSLLFLSGKTMESGQDVSPFDGDRIKKISIMDLAGVTSKCPDDASIYYCDPQSGVRSDQIDDEESPIIYVGDSGSCPPVDGVAMSSEMTPDTGGVSCRLLSVDIATAVPGTGARCSHLEGRIRYTPAL